MFRNLEIDEIECRVQSLAKNGKSVLLLLYKDARCDMNILDEKIGHLGWSRSHSVIGNRFCCTVSIYDKDAQQWVSKTDVGTESRTEKEKGQASDSFKRACFNWGIGRELYTAPVLRIDINKNEVNEYQGKQQLKGWIKFHVSFIKIKKSKIIEIEISDNNNNIRWSNRKNVTERKEDKLETKEINPVNFRKQVLKLANTNPFGELKMKEVGRLLGLLKVSKLEDVVNKTGFMQQLEREIEKIEKAENAKKLAGK